MQRNRHTPEFKARALDMVATRGTRTLESIATELNFSLGTLKGWLKELSTGRAGSPPVTALPGDLPTSQWTPGQRLLALNESHTLAGADLHAWCREKGLFEHQLIQWRNDICAAGQPTSASAAEQRQANAALRELQGRHDQLQREMRRKDRALAEAAALLVLQKKFQALVLRQSEDEEK